MTPKKKLLMVVSILCLVLCLCFSMTACRGQEGDGPGETKAPENQDAEEMTYQITVKSQGGVGLSGIELYVYDSDSKENFIAILTTDKDGNASFTYQAGEGYIAELGKVPDGYLTEKQYALTGENTEIVLKIQMVETDLNTVSYKLGDVMGDFTFTDINNQEHKLSQLITEKKAVMLVFFRMDDNACKTELSALQEVYDEYSKDIAVLAMNPTEKDNGVISTLSADMKLTFPMGACESTWESAMLLYQYPTTIVIDRFGTIALICGDVLDTAVKFQDIFNFFGAEDYQQTVVEDYKELLVTEDEDAVDNPVDISGQSSFELTLKPGKVHYLNLYKVSNIWMQIDHKDVFVEYGGKKFTASNGSVGLLVSAPSTFDPAQLGFGNSGEETITVTVKLSNLPGSYENPYTLQIGEFTASVSAGNNQGVYFRYTAAEDGYFKLQCLDVSPSVKYDVSVMNLTTSAMRNMSEESETDPDTGKQVLTMAMNKGEQLRITISALPDDSNNYPAATFKMLSTFTAGEVEDIVVVEKIAYGVTITDENRNPVAGVNITLTGTVPESDGTEEEGTEPPKPTKLNVVTDENGVASGYFPKDNYTGSIVIPAGYKATTTAFELTPEAPFASLKIDTHIVEMADYTVRIIDDEGAPVAGVLVTIGTIYGNTDEDGVFTANLEKGTYTALIGVPAGYKADAVSIPFPEDTTVLGVTLTKVGEGEQSGLTYTVQVSDAGGMGMTGILVTFYQYDSPVTMVPVDASGKAVAVLEAGEYVLTLTSSSGAVLKYNEAEAVVTETKTSAAITVSADISGSSHESAFWGSYYKLSTGSAWTKLTNTTNFVDDFGCYMYVFYPAQSGTYRFSVSEGAVLGYYGGINFPNGPSSDTNNEDGYFEQSVRDSEFANNNQPALVIGVIPESGVNEATITISRVGDAPQELPRIEYEPTCEIETFTLTQSGKVTYINLSGTANIVKKTDGFYYLNGKKLYINLSNSAPNLTFGSMLGIYYDTTTGDWVTSSMGTGMKGVIYEDDIPVGIEDFTACMGDYIRASDPVSGLYPLNDDLIYMIQSCGSYMGWWNEESPNYLFSSVNNLNTEIAWMFAVCTVG